MAIAEGGFADRKWRMEKFGWKMRIKNNMLKKTDKRKTKTRIKS